MKFAETSEITFDAQYTPDGKRVATAQVSGFVEIFDVTTDTVSKISSFKRHKDSCRSIRFYSDEKFLSCASNGSIGFGTGDNIEWLRKKTAVGANVIEKWGDHCFVVGDDNGMLEGYDLRTPATNGPLFRCTEHDDFISSVIFGKNDMLVSGAGDSRLGVFDLRTKKLFALSDEQEDEILSLEIIKDGEKVVCGGQTGTIALFQWGDFGDQKDRLPDHPESVDAMVKISEDAIVTGCSDGKLRVVSLYSQIHGNRILSVLGDHDDNSINGLTISPDQKEIVSCSVDSQIRFWSVEKALEALEVEDERERPKKKTKIAGENTQKMQAKAFFDEL